jgi:hypothetical protein
MYCDMCTWYIRVCAVSTVMLQPQAQRLRPAVRPEHGDNAESFQHVWALAFRVRVCSRTPAKLLYIMGYAILSK